MVQLSPEATPGAVGAERLPELVKETLSDAQELVRAELALFRDELTAEVKSAGLAVVLSVVAAFLLHTACLVAIAGVIALIGAEPLSIFLVAGALVLIALGGALWAAYAFTRRHMARTRERLSRNAQALLRFRHE